MIDYVDSEELEKGNPAERLGAARTRSSFRAASASAASRARFARSATRARSGVPILGICLGLQMMVIEYARNLLGLKRANSQRSSTEDTPDPVIDMMESQKDVSKQGRHDAPRRVPVRDHGRARWRRRSTSQAAIAERHRHRYEVNNDYREALEKAGFKATGTSPDDQLVEIMELPGHPWFLGCQFHPELKSRPLDCHPLFRGLIRAACSGARRTGAGAIRRCGSCDRFRESDRGQTPATWSSADRASC